MKRKSLVQAGVAASLILLACGANAQQYVVGSGDIDRDGISNRSDHDRDGDGVRNRRDDFPNNRHRS